MVLHWKPWSDEVLLEAQRDRIPLLLFLTARWSRFCAMMEATTFADTAVLDALAGRVVPVRVDAEDHPELAASYGQGGWPTTVFLSGSGEVICGGTFLDSAELVSLMNHAFARCRSEGEVDPPDRCPRPGDFGTDVLQQVEHALIADFDRQYGGFGEGHKFPHPEALDFALLRLSGGGREDLRELLVKTLSWMAQGDLHDHEGGGFYHYCERRDWTLPKREKRLDLNADLLRNYLEAGQVLDDPDLIEVGEQLADALVTQFFVADEGLFRQSTGPEEQGSGLPGDGAVLPPTVHDDRCVTEGNARAVSAFMKAGSVLQRPDLTAMGISTARRLIAKMYNPVTGMHRSLDSQTGPVPGLLRDQVAMARSLLHVVQYSDDRRCLPVLKELLDRIVHDYVTAEGDFADLDRVRRSHRNSLRDVDILESARAAEVLMRGALFFDRPGWTDLARRALEAHLSDYRRHGYGMAGYGRAVELLLHPPLHIIVVGSAKDSKTADLMEAASSIYLPSRVVQHLEPDEDEEVLRRLGLPPGSHPLAYVFLARDGVAAEGDPSVLPGILREANLRRLSC